MELHKIAIFASGTGSNAARIIEYFKSKQLGKIELVCTNRKDAAVVEVGREHQIPVLVFNREDLYSSNRVLDAMVKKDITHVVLAGFLWLIPIEFIEHYPGKIINIHPALLPKYGGKGMYGHHVHQAVRLANERETGITIHLVTKNYDEGEYLMQKKVVLSGEETAEQIAKKVQQLEHKYYPIAIEKWLENG